MKPWAAAVIVTVVIAVVAAAVVIYPLASTSETSSSTVSTTSATSTSTLASNGLQLRLALNATNLPSGKTLGVSVGEFNTKSVLNNVTKADLWAVQGLSLGACETEGYSVYPFGIAVYQGRYTEANVSQGTPLQVYAQVACPMLLRLVTGYVFQPMSDSAVILPSSGSSSPVPMNANVTVRGDYSQGTLQFLGPGVYTVAAGDEWGALATVQFSVGGGSQSSSTSSANMKGVLSALVTIGPIVPVCSANATEGPAPSPYSSINAVITPASGSNVTLPVNWLSNGCDVSGRFQAFLEPGSYQLNLSSCTFMGCKSALPENFTIGPGQQTTLSVSIDTGLR